jgi:endo-1,4-beta-xylanase
MKAPEQLKAVMTDHISRVMARTRGKVRGVDVINEPLAEYNGTMRHTPWHDAMGPDYIAIALQAAEQADPDAELWINEYGWDKDNPKDKERFQALFSLAKDLKGRGIRLDGIGLQGHVLESPRDTANLTVLRRRVDAFATLGVYVRISEIDVTEKAGRKEQAKQMANMLKLAISHPNITGYTTWGIGGPYVSTANVRNPRVEIRTPWDEQLHPTAIYEALQKAAA